jgi:limonene-1,2-epoxide hydrolase
MTSTEVVQQFLKAWETPGGWRQAIRDGFTDDCGYELVGQSKTVGPEQAITFVAAFEHEYPFAYMSVETLNVVGTENIVVIERIDRFHDAGGVPCSSMAALGIFEVRNGKISAWRDYCDLSSFKPSA